MAGSCQRLLSCGTLFELCEDKRLFRGYNVSPAGTNRGERKGFLRGLNDLTTECGLLALNLQEGPPGAAYVCVRAILPVATV